MIALWILAGILLIFLLPLGLRLRYNGKTRLIVHYAGIPVYHYDSEKDKKKEKKPKKKNQRKAPAAEKKNSTLRLFAERLQEDGVAGLAAYLREMARLVTTTARRLVRVLHFGRCAVNVIIGGEDAAATALRYGRLCGVVYPAKEILEKHLILRQLDFKMEPNFLQETDEIQLDIRVRALPLSILWAALRMGFDYIGMTMRLSGQEERKDGN